MDTPLGAAVISTNMRVYGEARCHALDISLIPVSGEIQDFGVATTGVDLRYKVGLHKSNLCGVHAFMDNDQEGRNAIEGAKTAHILEENEYQAAVCQGMNNSELEDFLRDVSYEDALRDEFGVQLLPKFMSTDKERMVGADPR